MSKKKGLSAAEKNSKMLEIFHETQDVFQLKDLEKIAPKTKGITLQSVKGVVQELVDNGLVETSKIGGSIYFWSFPGKNIEELKRKIEETNKKFIKLNAKIAALNELIEFEVSKQSDFGKIEDMQKEIEILRKRNSDLVLKVHNIKELDPELAQRKMKQSKAVFEAANRWTDNVFNTKTWCKNKFGMLDSDLNRNFRIPDDFDYLDEQIIK